MMKNNKIVHDPDNLRLFNRYRVDVRLIRENCETEPNIYTLVLPEKEMDWLQFSYDYETEASEDYVPENVSEHKKRERYCSIDPSGGPYIALGSNVISLWPTGHIRFDVLNIYENPQTKHWNLKVDNVVIEKD